MNKVIPAILSIIILAILVGLVYYTLQNNRKVNLEKPQITNNNQTEETMSTENQTVVLKTNKGDIKIELFNSQVPNTAGNFVKLASEGFYDGTRFHRVIQGFMIQGGDPLSRDEDQKAFWGTGGPGYQFGDEFAEGLSNVPGTISMANSGPNTNGSQFFINTAENTFLDGKHSVFGKVVEGMEIVKTIEQTETEPGDKPVEDMIVESVELF
jgi:cyclophilin family peptidyl-prolyl cis-trans isomerase